MLLARTASRSTASARDMSPISSVRSVSTTSISVLPAARSTIWRAISLIGAEMVAFIVGTETQRISPAENTVPIASSMASEFAASCASASTARAWAGLTGLETTVRSRKCTTPT